MSDDHLFRLALLTILAVILPIAAYHRVKSQMTGERLDRRQEGRFILATLRPVAVVTAIGVIAFLIQPESMAWASVPLSRAVRWIGVAIGMAGGALWAWTFWHLGPNLTDTVVTRQQHFLVMNGPYRWVRHPFYDAAGLFLLSLSIAAANWFLLVSSSVVLGLLVIRTSIEETNLRARFGESYRTYERQTGRFFPRL